MNENKQENEKECYISFKYTRKHVPLGIGIKSV